jgi:hypothetical protein
VITAQPNASQSVHFKGRMKQELVTVHSSFSTRSDRTLDSAIAGVAEMRHGKKWGAVHEGGEAARENAS